MRVVRVKRKQANAEGVTVPAFPSKSEAHRLLIAAALANRQTVIHCRSSNADISATADCLSHMGAAVRNTADGFIVTPIPQGNPEPAAPVSLDVGESGSTLRFLLPVLPALGIPARITMHGRLPDRPLAPLDRVLEESGVTVRKQADGTLGIRGRLRAGNYEIDGGVSSQFVSGLLFALPVCGGGSTLTVTGHTESAPYIGLTLDALRTFGVEVEETEHIFRIPADRSYRTPEPAEVSVGGDWSGAAFYLAAGAVGNTPVTVTGLDPNTRQGDRAVLPLLRRMGADCRVLRNGITVFPSKLTALHADASDIPDLVPILAVLGACAEGETVLHGVGRLRIKESDRLAAVSELLGTLGATVRVSPDSETLYVTGNPKNLCGGTVSSFGDHRIAMSAAVAALASNQPVTIADADAVNKSAPDFFERIGSLAEVKDV